MPNTVNVTGKQAYFSAETVPMKRRALARELRFKVINELDSERRTASLHAACALQMMSDRNFNQVPAKVKEDCREAVENCMRAWADHGAHEKGC